MSNRLRERISRAVARNVNESLTQSVASSLHRAIGTAGAVSSAMTAGGMTSPEIRLEADDMEEGHGGAASPHTVEDYLHAKAAYYHRDRNMAPEAIKTLLQDDFMDDFGHRHNIEDYALLIDQLSKSPDLREGTVLLTKGELYDLFVEACGDVHAMPAVHSVVAEPEGRVMGHGGTARMARSSLQNVASATQSLHDRLQDDDELPEWVQAKIAGILDDVHEIEDHLGYKMQRQDELG